MAMLAVRISLGIGSVLLAMQWPIPVLLGVWALVVWLVPRSYRDYRENRELRGLIAPSVEQIHKLQADLTTACLYSTALEQQITELEARAMRSTSPTDQSFGHPLYRRVGLDQDCPRWVAEGVRREYRRRLHPDSKPPHLKAEAERRFKEAEEVFGKIWRARGF